MLKLSPKLENLLDAVEIVVFKAKHIELEVCLTPEMTIPIDVFNNLSNSYQEYLDSIID